MNYLASEAYTVEREHPKERAIAVGVSTAYFNLRRVGACRCNCTLCRRYGALWAYYSPKDVRLTNDATDIYMWGKRVIEFHRCKHCGCITHWAPVYKPYDRMGVNARLMAPEVLDQVHVRRHDGANT